MDTKEQTTLLLPADNIDMQPTRRLGGTGKKKLAYITFAVLIALVLIAISVLSLAVQRASFPATSHVYQSTRVYHRTPPPSPTPAPIQPLPNTLQGDIDTLTAHNRFFYNGNINLPEIALTFDDGPNPDNTPQILNILKKYRIHATFFDLGRLVELYPDLVKQEIAEGNVVGNHTWSHPDLPSLAPDAIQAQIKDTYNTLLKVTGIRPIFFRPPYGDLSAQTLKIVNYFGLSTVVWNNDSRDWSMPGTSQIVTGVLNSVNNGTIILLHDGGGNRLQTIAALPTIIENLLARHFRFVTLAEMAAHAQVQPNQPTPTPTAPLYHQQFFVWQREFYPGCWRLS
ncbi:MAG TPA: polysaccharide deacetylase family protein [Ktedonobacteraceae bacterium]|nr:polysaccharide deacetylase family protein [Ktedonobacteraceae bacterium]